MLDFKYVVICAQAFIVDHSFKLLVALTTFGDLCQIFITNQALIHKKYAEMKGNLCSSIYNHSRWLLKSGCEGKKVGRESGGEKFAKLYVLQK